MKIVKLLFALIVLAMPLAYCDPSSNSSIRIITNSNEKNNSDDQKNTPSSRSPATNGNRTPEARQRNTPPSRSPATNENRTPEARQRNTPPSRSPATNGNRKPEVRQRNAPPSRSPATNENRKPEVRQRNTPPSQSPATQNPEPQDNADWDIALLDTARKVDYLSEIEKDVILEMNKARSNPKKYAELYLVPFAKRFQSNGTYMKGNITMRTTEGVDAVNECIEEMSMKKRAMEILKPEKGLSLAAQSHATSQAKTGQVGHNGIDGSTPFTRIKKYGTYHTAGENIAYGSKSGQEIVIDLLVDDGVKSRGHRENILNPEFKQTGVGYAEGHKAYGTVCVMTYAGGYEERK